MRHALSLLLALLLAPLIWVLADAGLGRTMTGGSAPSAPTDGVLIGYVLLVLAGVGYAALVLPRHSPAGPVLAGAAMVAGSLWILVDRASFDRALAVTDRVPGGGDLALPAAGLAVLLAVPLLATALSADRWRGPARAAATPATPYPPAWSYPAQPHPPASPYPPYGSGIGGQPAAAGSQHPAAGRQHPRLGPVGGQPPAQRVPDAAAGSPFGAAGSPLGATGSPLGPADAVTLAGQLSPGAGGPIHPPADPSGDEDTRVLPVPAARTDSDEVTRPVVRPVDSDDATAAAPPPAGTPSDIPGEETTRVLLRPPAADDEKTHRLVRPGGNAIPRPEAAENPDDEQTHVLRRPPAPPGGGDPPPDPRATTGR